MTKKKVTQEELEEIVKHFKHVHACLERGVSGCCEAKLVPAAILTEEEVKKGCSMYCSKCGTCCGFF